jgi:SAM-dependent methyltransferase
MKQELAMISKESMMLEVSPRERRDPRVAAADYRAIVAHYESCLAQHGDNHRGVDWPNAEDAKKRYRVMLEVVRASDPRPLKMLDFGCGAGHLLEYLREERRQDIHYIGLDASAKFIDLSRRKFPEVEFLCADVMAEELTVQDVDYVVMNGVFTEKCSLSFEAMWQHFCSVLRRVFPVARRGIAFNLMSKHVDWERDDLFHVPLDLLAGFIKQELSRNYVMRADYGLYEYTTYVYR